MTLTPYFGPSVPHQNLDAWRLLKRLNDLLLAELFRLFESGLTTDVWISGVTLVAVLFGGSSRSCH